jgi:hypothetical protein
MLLVASVVSTADQKITNLEADKVRLQREASTIRTVLGNPIWSVRALPAAPSDSDLSVENASETNQADSQKKAEQEWIARYATLGNALGAIVVILEMLSGVLTYFAANFKIFHSE